MNSMSPDPHFETSRANATARKGAERTEGAAARAKAR